jgi:predicted ABC-type ATPase
MKEIIVIGGANGSGKTTLAREVVAAYGIEYLAADEIAAKLNADSPESAAVKAARVFSRRLDELLQANDSFIIESTLSGLSLKRRLGIARANGFRVRIYFVYLDSAELCVRRIASRVAKGGHSIPERDVRRRFPRSNQNFWSVYKNLADEWSLFFNAGDSFQQIAAGVHSSVIILDETRYAEWLRMAENKTAK